MKFTVVLYSTRQYNLIEYRMVNSQEEYLTIDEAAKRLKVARATVYRMARRGKIPAVKFGSVWRISGLKLAEMFEGKVRNK